MNSQVLFRRIFKGIHAAITATFVCTVAYAATVGAFGDSTSESTQQDDCNAVLDDLSAEMVKTASDKLQIQSTERVESWNAVSASWLKRLDNMKRSCASATQRRRALALVELQQAYTSAILAFNNRARNAIELLTETATATRDSEKP